MLYGVGDLILHFIHVYYELEICVRLAVQLYIYIYIFY